MYFGVFIVNFEHISHLALHEIWQNMSFILEKRKKSNKFNRLLIEVFFLQNISPLYISPPPSPEYIPSNLSPVRIYAQGILTGFYGM